MKGLQLSSTVDNIFCYRCMSDCSSRGPEFNPGLTPYFLGDFEIISRVIIPLPLNHSRRVVVSYKQKYVHKVLVNYLLKLVQQKVW